jgi:hypothetical protein
MKDFFYVPKGTLFIRNNCYNLSQAWLKMHDHSYNWKGSVQVWGWWHTKSFYSNLIKHEFKTDCPPNETKHICTQVGECTCGIY